MKIGKNRSVAKDCLSFDTQEGTSQTGTKERNNITDIIAEYCKCSNLLCPMSDVTVLS